MIIFSSFFYTGVHVQGEMDLTAAAGKISNGSSRAAGGVPTSVQFLTFLAAADLGFAGCHAMLRQRVCCGADHTFAIAQISVHMTLCIDLSGD